MFLSNGITREYWVDFLQRCYDYLCSYEIEKFDFFCSVIRDDIFTMFENDFALCDSDEKAIENKKTLYNTLYEKQFNNSVSSPYSDFSGYFYKRRELWASTRTIVALGAMAWAHSMSSASSPSHPPLESVGGGVDVPLP